jgi:hypothetical protein
MKGLNSLEEIMRELNSSICFCGKKSFLSFQDKEKKTEEERECEEILNSKLFSGGIEQKYMNILTKQRSNKMKEIVNIN